MTKQELIERLKNLEEQHRYNIMGHEGIDHEVVHIKADELLLEYINDPDIREAFEVLQRWYA